MRLGAGGQADAIREVEDWGHDGTQSKVGQMSERENEKVGEGIFK